jgi:flavin reductase (DIM6/NTAB) family NADH-FMN oxidoreductase RutF
MKSKVDFDASQTLAPLPVVLVGCAHAELGLNLLTVAWTGIDCSDPPAIHVSIRPGRHSHRMIAESGCFTVNVPIRDLLRQLDLCGIVSGRDGDKWRRAGLTPLTGTSVAAPLVAECPVNFECALARVVPLGAHDMFIGEIVARHADADLVRGGRVDFSKLPLVAYVNGEYWSLGERIGTYGFSGKERA